MSRAKFFLEQIEIVRMPGFPTGRGFTVSGLCPGVNIIFGPNASGKTTLARAILILLHSPERADGDPILKAQVRWGQTVWNLQYQRENKQARCIWQLQDQQISASAPPISIPPILQRHYCFGLPDLLAAEEKAADLAEHILRELRGGYDLQQAYQDLNFQDAPSQLRKLPEDFRNAQQKVKRLQQEQEESFQRLADLENLHRQHQEAIQAAHKVQMLQKALELHKAQAQYRQAQAKLEGFPSPLAQMTGQETARLEEIRKRLEDTRQQYEHLQRELQRVEGQLADLALPAQGIHQDRLAAWRSQVDELHRIYQQIGSLQEKLSIASGQVEEARKALGTWSEECRSLNPTKIDLPKLQELGEWGRSFNQVWAKLQAAQQLQQWWEEAFGSMAMGAGPTPMEPLRQQADLLRRAAERLPFWLAAEEQFRLRQQNRSRRQKLLLMLAAAAAVGAVCLGLMVHVSWWLVLGVAVGLVLWAFWPDSQPDPRLPHQQALESLQIDFLPWPPRWDVLAVQQCLYQIDDQMRRIYQQIALSQVQQQAAIRWKELQNQITQLHTQHQQIEQKKWQFAQQCGFSPKTAEQDPTWLAVFAAAVRRLHEAEENQAAAQYALDALLQKAAELARQLTTALQEYGFEESLDPHRLEAQVALLEQRQRAHTELSNQLAQFRRDYNRLQADIASLQNEQQALLAKFGLQEGEESQLYIWSDMLGQYRKALQERDEAKGALQAAEEAWSAVAQNYSEQTGIQPPPLPQTEAEIQQELDACRSLAAQLPVLARQIGEWEKEIDQAKKQHELETALADLDHCRAALQEQFHKDSQAVVGHVLVEWLRRQEQVDAHHPVLRQANQWLQRFTGGRYRLELHDKEISAKKPSGRKQENIPAYFSVWDTVQEKLLSLDAMSSGTRVQMLLAARMAFLQQQETSLIPLQASATSDGLQLPMIFDETLANSDDQRTEQIIQALLELAQQGRQIVYLTAQEDELDKWKRHLLPSPAAVSSCADGSGSLSAPETQLCWKIFDLAQIRRLHGE